MADAGRGGVTLEGVSKRFGEVEAVRDLSLEIGESEFFSLLGPSGCGKTTTLRLIAGFEEPTGGRILIGGTDVTATPPHKRPVNTVFQSYALFTHLSVKENVAFGLRFRKVTKREKDEKVTQALALVQLEGLERRRPSQLSGGQQQRVALARALVLEPRVLLLDEPLGALDAKLRRALQLELKELQRRVGITFVYVTHDQEEALTMSDRMAVMRDGLIQQLGTPKEVYEEPATVFVADFLGASNLMTGEALGGGRVLVGETVLVAGGGELAADVEVRITIRPERIRIEPADTEGENHVPARVERLVYYGATTQILLRLEHGETLQAMIPAGGGAAVYEEGMEVTVHLPPENLRVLPSGS
jgi:spermidine/putrescine transport system ATP-binding protein